MPDNFKCPHCAADLNICSLIGPTADDCPRCGKRALPAPRLLKNAQARAVADALAALNNAGGTMSAVFFDGENRAVTVNARDAIGVAITELCGFREVARERYATQCDFIAAYIGE